MIDTGSSKISTGPFHPPLTINTALLPEMLFIVVKSDAVLVFGEPILLDAPLILDLPTAGSVPVYAVPVDP